MNKYISKSYQSYGIQIRIAPMISFPTRTYHSYPTKMILLKYALFQQHSTKTHQGTHRRAVMIQMTRKTGESVCATRKHRRNNLSVKELLRMLRRSYQISRKRKRKVFFYIHWVFFIYCWIMDSCSFRSLQGGPQKNKQLWNAVIQKSSYLFLLIFQKIIAISLGSCGVKMTIIRR